MRLLQLELSGDLLARLEAAAVDTGIDADVFALLLLDASLPALVPRVHEGDEAPVYRRSQSASLTWDG